MQVFGMVPGCIFHGCVVFWAATRTRKFIEIQASVIKYEGLTKLGTMWIRLVPGSIFAGFWVHLGCLVIVWDVLGALFWEVDFQEDFEGPQGKGTYNFGGGEITGLPPLVIQRYQATA